MERNGIGTNAAHAAMKKLSSSGPESLPTIAASFSKANPLAANWLRSAFETIASRALDQGQQLPADELQTFIANTKNDPRARRMVFEWLSKVDKKLGDKMIPGLLLDPSPEFRRDAVARLIRAGGKAQKTNKKDDAIQLFEKAMSGAVHADQVDSIVEALDELGKKVDVQKHFGFLPDWHLIGPFDNKDRKGFAVSYPPESKVDLSGTYNGQLGEVSWKEYSTDDSYGLLNIADQIKNYKGSCMYAFTEFESKDPTEVEFRLGTPNAWKLWLNGKLIFEREEYHRSTQMDQYRVPVKLTAGRNTILLKVCQNEQTQEWAQRYQYQFRVCNSTGSGIAPAAVKTSLRVK